MTRRTRSARVWGCILGLAVAVGAACKSTSPPPLAYCPSYKGGSATYATLLGSYTLVSFCQDTLPPAQGVTGSLVMTVGTPDSFKTLINNGPTPVALAGPYTLSKDTIAVTLGAPASISFIATYAFDGSTLSVSGTLPGTAQPLAIVFHK
ncbi:MAG TPA: hypothetical protein VH158_02215 [Gemmatimonadales bacterium]|jgi:hypothetical protein|nr:hypothetical protein [Gemmatimonadales bacterium]